MSSQKSVLFFPLNSPGHINSLLGIADVLKAKYGFRTIFLLLGDHMGNEIEKNNHELITLKEAHPYEDYEVDFEQDHIELEVDEEEAKKKGLVKKLFPGVMKWPQILNRYGKALQGSPEEVAKAMEKFDSIMVGEVLDNHDNYNEVIQRIKPSLIVLDAYFIPPCIVKQTEIPWVRVFSANPIMLPVSKLPRGERPPPMSGLSLMTKAERQRMRIEEPEKWQALLDFWYETMTEKSPKPISQKLLDFMESYGVEPPRAGQQAHESPFINFYMFPKELDFDQDDDIFEYPSCWFRCNSLMRQTITSSDPSAAKKWSDIYKEAVKGKRQVIFFSLGSIASGNSKLIQTFVDIFKNDQERLYVISKGVNGDKVSLDANNMIGGNYIPQTFFLEKADLAIVHGGNNSVTECMYYGVPLIVLPMFADQLDNAQRMVDLGLGKRLDPRTCTAEELNKAIDDVLSDSKIKDRIKRISESVKQNNDCNKVAFMLNKLVDDGRLDKEFIDEWRYKDF